MLAKIYKLLPLFTFLTFISCNSVSTYEIEGSLEGIQEDGMAYLISVEKNRTQTVLDSTAITAGQFTFSGEVPVLKMYFININQTNMSIPLFIEEGTISVKGNLRDRNSLKVVGTAQNDFYDVYKTEIETFQDRLMGIANDLKGAQAKNDQAQLASLREEHKELIQEVRTYELQFIDTHPDAFLSMLILASRFQQLDIDGEKCLAYFEKLNPNIQNSAEGIELKDAIAAALSIKVGAKAEDFEAPTPDGTSLKLSENLGSKATIIDFWAAWCKPCRAANPHLKELYAKYHEQGLNVIGVSLDDSKEDWLKAIEDDELPWLQVSHLKLFDGPIATLYNIKAIPSAFVLDAEGKIVAKDVSGFDLDSILEDIFKN